MNLLKIIGPISLFALFLACAGNSEEQQENTATETTEIKDQPDLEDSFSWELTDGDCADKTGECSRVSVDFQYPENVSAELKASVAYYFDSLAVAVLQDHTNDSSKTSIRELAALFIEDHEQMAEAHQAWYVDFMGEVLFETDEWISVEFREYSFRGGAHGYHQKRIKSFSKTDQKPLEFSDLNIDKNTLEAAFEKQFRQQFEIPQGATMQDSYFWFEGDSFSLNDNYALVNDSLIFLYNPYEIAVYSMGIIKVGLPLEKIKYRPEL